MIFYINERLVPKAPIAGADINSCYLEAVIKIRATNAYLVPGAAIEIAITISDHLSILAGH